MRWNILMCAPKMTDRHLSLSDGTRERKNKEKNLKKPQEAQLPQRYRATFYAS